MQSLFFGQLLPLDAKVYSEIKDKPLFLFDILSA